MRLFTVAIVELSDKADLDVTPSGMLSNAEPMQMMRSIFVFLRQ